MRSRLLLWLLILAAGLLILPDLAIVPLKAQEEVRLNHAGFPAIDPPEEWPDSPPFILPFAEPPGPDTWLLGQPYGNTTGAYIQRNIFYQAGQGLHFGLDFSAPCGTEIVAIGDGIVSEVDSSHGSWPHNLTIDHPNGYSSFYGHLLEKAALTPGRPVKQGDVVALTGDSFGTCRSAPHLHLEIRNNFHTRAYNPVPLIQADWDSLALVGSFSRGFERDLTDPRRWQTIYDQPNVAFGGPLLNDYTNPWPPDRGGRTDAAATRQPAAGATFTPTVSPTAIPRSTPSPSPVPSLRRLTDGGCCVQPDFSPDGQQVLFIDKPDKEAPVGIYAVDRAAPEAAPTLINRIIGFRSPDRTVVATLDEGLAYFTNEKSGESWTVDTAGNWPRYSPDGSRILWVAGDREGPYDKRQNDIWLANLDGSQAQRLLSVYGGGFVDWFPDGERLLLVGRDLPGEERVTLFVYNLKTGQRTDLFSHKRLRGAELSPGGSWVLFFLSMTDDEPVENGLWAAGTDGTRQHRLDVPGFGGYRWRNDNTLLYIPMRTSSEDSMQLWSVDVPANQTRPLTDPATFSFSISNGDWEVSPDGQSVLFVSSRDQNIWLMTLPQ